MLSTISQTKNKVILVMIGIIGFYAAFTLLSDAGAIAKVFQNVRPELIGAIFAFEAVSLFMRGIRQQQFLKHIGVNLPFSTSLKIFFAGMSFVATPGGSGELIKSHYIKNNYGFTVSKTFPVVFLERYHDLLVGTVIIALTLLLIVKAAAVIIVVVSVLLLSTIFVIIKNQGLLIRMEKRLENSRFFHKLAPSPEFNQSLWSLMKAMPFAKGFGISFLSWSFTSASVAVAFFAFGLDIPFFESSQMYFTSLGYGALSLLPGGVGVTEGSFLGLLVTAGVDVPTSSALVLLVRLSTIWFATVVGFVATRFVLRLKQYNDDGGDDTTSGKGQL